MHRTNTSNLRPSPLQHRQELAAPELAPRFEPGTIARYKLCLLRQESTPYDAPEDCSRADVAARFLWPLVEHSDREIVGVLLLDTQGRAIGHHVAYVGTLTRTAVEPRGIVVPALLASAAAIVLFHNHPMGEPTPSQQDLDFTRLVVLACDAVGLTLWDHLILADQPRYVSLQEAGLL